MRLALALLVVAGSAHADRYVVQRGETLAHVANAHGCSVDAVMRANNLRTTLVKPGTAIDVPSCSLRARARVRSPAPRATARDSGTARAKAAAKRTLSTADAKARAALDVIDGATWTAASLDTHHAPRISAGAPWDGKLLAGERLPGDDGYRIRRPSRAYGARHVIDYLRGAIAIVRALYPDVHTVAIGDLSAEHGGKLDNHRSHQTGLDVDVGFYFTRVPAGYPDTFSPAGANLDIAATWALVTAFARTAELDDGVEIIFLDHAVQRRLYDWARARGTPDADLAHLLQYPRGKDSYAGLVRHWPNHADHLHVRFRSRR